MVGAGGLDNECRGDKETSGLSFSTNTGILPSPRLLMLYRLIILIFFVGTSQEGDTEVFIMPPEEPLTSEEQVLQTIGHIPLFVKQRGDIAHPFKTPCFWEEAFPLLYPYGVGCPLESEVTRNEYVKHMLKLGGRRQFQQCSSWVFASYYYLQTKRIGGVIARATEGEDEEGIRVGDVRSILPLESDVNVVESPAKLDPLVAVKAVFDASIANSTANIAKVVKRLTPYGKAVPGSIIHINNIRKDALALISSPIVTHDADISWFITNAYSDVYDSTVFAILHHEDVIKRFGYDTDLYECDEGAYSIAEGLSIEQRKAALHNHPALVCRVFALLQEAFKKCILFGHHQPLGKFIASRL